jgi:hypothetical protein
VKPGGDALSQRFRVLFEEGKVPASHARLVTSESEVVKTVGTRPVRIAILRSLSDGLTDPRLHIEPIDRRVKAPRGTPCRRPHACVV